jgi:hypothetical protein
MQVSDAGSDEPSTRSGDREVFSSLVTRTSPGFRRGNHDGDIIGARKSDREISARSPIGESVAKTPPFHAQVQRKVLVVGVFPTTGWQSWRR